MKELIRVRVRYASRQQCCKTHKRPLPLPLTVRNFLCCNSECFCICRFKQLYLCNHLEFNTCSCELFFSQYTISPVKILTFPPESPCIVSNEFESVWKRWSWHMPGMAEKSTNNLSRQSQLNYSSRGTNRTPHLSGALRRFRCWSHYIVVSFHSCYLNFSISVLSMYIHFRVLCSSR